MTTEQPEALRLAAELDDGYPLTGDAISAAAELRRQHARITELESQLAQRFDAADMATAAAQGFRDGAAKEQQAGAFQAALDIRTAQGWKLGGDKAPVLYTDEINGQQVCRDDVWLCTTDAFTHPSPPEGMAGWQPIETAPKDGLRVILTEGGRVFRGMFVTVEFRERRDSDGNYIDQTDPDAYWMDLASGDVCYPTHWQPEAPLPPPPSSAQKD